MADTALLGHLALKFADHPEDWASEGLGHVLRRSGEAAEAMSSFLGTVGMALPRRLAFSNQVTGDDNARPDLVGRDTDGVQVLVIETKFWAPLTENQPVTYLQRVPSGRPSAVLVISPALRLHMLWTELLRRVAAGNFQAGKTKRVCAEVIAAPVNAEHWLVLASWRAVLGALGHHLDAARDVAASADVVQLQGLAEMMDTSAFLPVRPAELTSGAYRRVLDFSQLVEDVATVLFERGVCSRENLRPAPGLGYYGRYMLMHGVGVFLSCDIRRWTLVRATPLWLELYGYNWKDTSTLRPRLASLEEATPPRLILDEGKLVVPLELPVGVPKEEVVEMIAAQVAGVADLLAGGDAAGLQPLPAARG
jgi:hypothetical protein